MPKIEKNSAVRSELIRKNYMAPGQLNNPSDEFQRVIYRTSPYGWKVEYRQWPDNKWHVVYHGSSEKEARKVYNGLKNPVAHFPKGLAGRPPKKRGRGRPRKDKHTGIAAFFPEFQKRKRKKSKGRPSTKAYWIADGFVNGKLYITYIGQGTKNNATIEAKSLIGHKVGNKHIDKVMLSGPYPMEDGRPDGSWPRL